MDEFRTTETAAPMNEWPVDLSREENTRFTLLLAKLSGPLRLHKIQLFVTLAFFVLVVGFCVFEWVKFAVFDWITLVVGVGLLAVSFGLWWYMPRHVRKSAEKAYDDKVAGGYQFSGMLRVRDDRIEKENTQGLYTVMLDTRTMFIETPDAMVFFSAGRTTLVLPARYLTSDAVAALRAAADKLPYRNRRFIGRIQPQGIAPTPVPAVEDIVLWEENIRYEVDELAGFIRHYTKQNFSRRLPLHAVVSLLVAAFFAVDRASMPTAIIAFFVTFAVLLLLNLVLPLRNAKAHAAASDAATRTTKVKFTDRGVWLCGVSGMVVVIPWTKVEHVVDHDLYVEITRGSQFIRIPKRYIPSLSEFDILVTSLRNKTDSK